MTNKPRDVMRPNEVAARLGVDEATVRRWCAEGELPSLKIGGSIFVNRALFEDMLDAQRFNRAAALGEHFANTDGSGRRR